MKLSSRIYITGFMGCGKSTLGPLLAEALDYAFLDLDEQIERMAGRSIRSLFDDGGEEAFRREERKAVRATYALERTVVAVGGGALAERERMRDALRHGLVVYLSLTERALLDRLMEADVDRPLLDDPDSVSGLLRRRDPVYRLADIVLELDGVDVEESAHALVETVRAYGKKASGD